MEFYKRADRATRGQRRITFVLKLTPEQILILKRLSHKMKLSGSDVLRHFIETAKLSP